jgi:hypothetical protein
MGLECEVVMDGQACINAFRSNTSQPFDLILMDCQVQLFFFLDPHLNMIHA